MYDDGAVRPSVDGQGQVWDGGDLTPSGKPEVQVHTLEEGHGKVEYVNLHLTLCNLIFKLNENVWVSIKPGTRALTRQVL